MSENAHGIRRFTLAATVARNFKPLPVHGFGIVVYSAPADASAVLQLGDQDGAQLPLKPGLRFRSPVPFDKLYLTNVAGASGNVDFLVVTDPEAEAAYGGLGDITMSGVSPQMDDTDKQAVSVYGKAVAAGDTPMLVDASGSVSIGPKAGTASITDAMSNGPQGPRTFGGADLHQIVRGLAYNGASWDRLRNNEEAVALASAARTTSTQSPVIINYNARGLVVFCNVTANPGGAQTLALSLYGRDTVSGLTAIAQNSGAATALGGGAGVLILVVYPGALDIDAPAGAVQRDSLQSVVPRQFRLGVSHSGAGSWTYSLGFTLIL